MSRILCPAARPECLRSRIDGSIRQLDAREYQQERRVEWENTVAATRTRLRLSQTKFAELLGISVKTLHNWEQGRRKPTGAARVLLRVAARHPEVILEQAMV